MKWKKRLAIGILGLEFWIMASVSYSLNVAAEASSGGAIVRTMEGGISDQGMPSADDTSSSLDRQSVDSHSSNPDGQALEDGASTTSSQIALVIDNLNRYEGMGCTYSEGYIPKVDTGSVYLVVPILCSGQLQNNCMRASLNLGDLENTPFVLKNYEKTIYLQQSSVNNNNATVESYVAAFQLELKSEHYNGSYPVIVSVKGKDELGMQVSQDFTIYVNISDGKDKKEDDSEEEKTFPPKVVIQSCQFSKPDIQAGDEIAAEITLVNTAKTEEVRDLVVTINAETEILNLLDQSDTQYVESVPASGVFVAHCRFRVNKTVAQGQYALELKMSYTDSKANECSSDGKVMVAVAQPTQVQFDPPVIPSEVEVADTIEVSVQVMNLGRSKVYNVRAILEADGLQPKGTLFVGDLEEGSMGTGSTQVVVGSLSSGGNLYGKTEGQITFYYEDEAGVYPS